MGYLQNSSSSRSPFRCAKKPEANILGVWIFNTIILWLNIRLFSPCLVFEGLATTALGDNSEFVVRLLIEWCLGVLSVSIEVVNGICSVLSY